MYDSVCVSVLIIKLISIVFGALCSEIENFYNENKLRHIREKESIEIFLGSNKNPFSHAYKCFSIVCAFFGPNGKREKYTGANALAQNDRYVRFAGMA